MTDYTGSNTPVEQRNLWQTPRPIFEALNAEFSFVLDAAASAENALCRRFITAEQDTLVTPWADYMTIPGYAWLKGCRLTPLRRCALQQSNFRPGSLWLWTWHW